MLNLGPDKVLLFLLSPYTKSGISSVQCWGCAPKFNIRETRFSSFYEIEGDKGMSHHKNSVLKFLFVM